MKNKTRGRFFLLATLLLILAMVVTPVMAVETSQNPPDQQMTLVVLGDSIAWGASAPAGQGYASRVAHDQNMILINRAVGGWRTEHVINQLKTDVLTQEAIKAADVIQIAIGGNDLQQAGYIGPAIDALVLGDKSVWEQHSKNVADRFAQIVDLVHELNPQAPFFVFNSYTPDYKRFGDNIIGLGGNEVITGNMLYALAQDYAIPYFNSTYLAYLEQNPGAFILVDIFDAFPGNDSLYYGSGLDTIHPSAFGHEKLADRLNAAIDAYQFPITSLRIDALSITTVARGGEYSFGLILNAGATGDNVEWALATPSLGYVDHAGNVKIFDKTGNVRLTATDPISGKSHSITLRIAS